MHSVATAAGRDSLMSPVLVLVPGITARVMNAATAASTATAGAAARRIRPDRWRSASTAPTTMTRTMISGADQ